MKWMYYVNRRALSPTLWINRDGNWRKGSLLLDVPSKPSIVFDWLFDAELKSFVMLTVFRPIIHEVTKDLHKPVPGTGFCLISFRPWRHIARLINPPSPPSPWKMSDFLTILVLILIKKASLCQFSFAWHFLSEIWFFWIFPLFSLIIYSMLNSSVTNG